MSKADAFRGRKAVEDGQLTPEDVAPVSRVYWGPIPPFPANTNTQGTNVPGGVRRAQPVATTADLVRKLEELLELNREILQRLDVLISDPQLIKDQALLHRLAGEDRD